MGTGLIDDTAIIDCSIVYLLVGCAHIRIDELSKLYTNIHTIIRLFPRPCPRRLNRRSLLTRVRFRCLFVVSCWDLKLLPKSRL
jgi:hypothetical protein